MVDNFPKLKSSIRSDCTTQLINTLGSWNATYSYLIPVTKRQGEETGKKQKKQKKTGKYQSSEWLRLLTFVKLATEFRLRKDIIQTDGASSRSKPMGVGFFYPLQTKKSDILLSVVKGLWNKKWKSTSNKHWLTSKKNPDWHRGDGRK